MWSGLTVPKLCISEISDSYSGGGYCVVNRCFKCKIGHIQAVCKTTIYFAAINDKLCNFDPIKLNISNESYCGQIHDIILSDMRRSHDSCISSEIIYKYVEDISSAPNPYQNSGVILSGVVCPIDLFISRVILTKQE
ncbi:unnamed protein product [Schistosoma curassoni]|uniref:Glycoprotein n=1 Tax=Schistosoma curassoni TaxID=6186 RepID=A0A183JP51_9TREM|nr:unnamed protein product [Schistosoma curassoni]